MRSCKWNLQSTLWEELWAHRLLKHVTLLETSSIPSRNLPRMVWRTHMPTHREELLQTQLIYPLKVLSKLLPQNFFKTLVVRTLSLVDPLLHHMLMQTIMRQDKPAAWLLAIMSLKHMWYQNLRFTVFKSTRTQAYLLKKKPTLNKVTSSSLNNLNTFSKATKWIRLSMFKAVTFTPRDTTETYFVYLHNLCLE